MATLRGADSKTLAAPCWPASYLSLVQPRARALPTNEGEDAAQKKKNVALDNKQKREQVWKERKGGKPSQQRLKIFLSTVPLPASVFRAFSLSLLFTLGPKSEGRGRNGRRRKS